MITFNIKPDRVRVRVTDLRGMITFNIKPDRASTKTPCSSLDLGLCLGPGSGLDQG